MRCRFDSIIYLILLLVIISCGKKKADDPLADTGRTQRTESLLEKLKDIPQKGFLFGHQDATLYGIGWQGDSCRSDVKSVCGDFPAVVGFEIGGIENGDSLNIDGIPFDKIRREIINHYDRGGMITISWHAGNPLTGGTSWVSGNDSVNGKAPQTVASVLDGGKANEKFIGWLDRVADFMKSLETPYGVRVPVLFRPWHEHTGNWFWWGQDFCTADQYKTLWKMTVERLKKQDVVNVLYAYSPGIECNGNKDKYLERYPDDSLVDLLGVDCYCNAEEGDTLQMAAYSATLDKNLDMICGIAEKYGKAVALTETGYEGLRHDKWWTEILLPVVARHPVSYVLVWRNAHDKPGHFFAPYPGQRTTMDFVSFCNEKKTLFLHDVNGLYLKKKSK